MEKRKKNVIWFIHSERQMSWSSVLRQKGFRHFYAQSKSLSAELLVFWWMLQTKFSQEWYFKWFSGKKFHLQKVQMKQTELISRWAKQNVTLLGIFINKSMWFIGFNLAFLRHAFKPFRIKLVIPWENKTLGDFPKYIPPQKRSTSLCRNDIKYSHNNRNNAQNFMFKKKLKILGFKSWAELCQWCWMLVLDAGASKVFPTHPAAVWAYLTLFMGYAAHEAASMTQFSHFSDHLQPPWNISLPRSAGLWFLVKCPSHVIKRKQERCKWAITDWV